MLLENCLANTGGSCLEFQRIKSFIYWLHNSKTFHEWGNKWLLDCEALLCTLVSSVMLAVGLLKWEKHNRESSCNPRLDGSMMTHVEEITTQPVGLYCVLFARSTNWMRCVNMRERGKERERERETAVSSFSSSSQWFDLFYLENDLPLTI